MSEHGLSDDTWAHTLHVHDAALASGTKAAYKRALDRFRIWAAAERVLSTTFPIPEPVLCAYAASFAGIQSGSAARTAMAGLRFEHDRQGAIWAGSSRLARIVDAVGQMTPDSSIRQQRPPVTLAMIDAALEGLDPGRGFDQCVGAAMMVAFWGQMRLGEILSPTRKGDLARLPAVKHLALRHDAGGKPSQEVTALWIPRTKTAKRGEWVWLARHHNDPSFALQEHIKDNRLGRNDLLFAYRDDDDELVALTKSAFLGRLNEIWEAAGMEAVSGHCFRIGGTTALLRLGVDTDVVKMSGRWKSDAFLRYWRSVDSIIAQHTDLCDITWQGDEY